ncbi:MAG: hypothetical protein SFY69_08335 [Planctomycetota bacterium]|nr:hypothetical protein [Planctomycetota bacterium]
MKRRRRGGVYALVLCVGVALTGLGIAALGIVRVQRTSAEAGGDAADARRAAASAFEIVCDVLHADPRGTSWRADKGPYTAVNHADAGLRMAGTLADPAGDLTADTGEPVRLEVLAAKGAARQGLRADALPSFGHLASVTAGCVWAGGSATFNGTTVFADDVIGANGAMHAVSASVAAPVAAGAITGSSFQRSTRVLTEPVEMPGPGVVAAWSAMGTPIAYASLTGGELRDVVLSSSSNPFGAADPNGIYVIDCRGAPVRLRECRIVGTLVLVDVGAGAQIMESVLLEPGAGGVSLIVDGSIAITQTSTDFAESSLRVNLNPAGTPYRGVSDADQSDSYPGLLRGLIYATGDVACKGVVTIEGVLLVGRHFATEGRLTVRAARPATPAPGFRETVGWSIDGATLTRVVE